MPQHKTTSGLSLHSSFRRCNEARRSPLLHSSTSGLRHGSIATHNISQRVLIKKWQRPGEFGCCFPLSSLPYPTPALALNNLALLLKDTNRLLEAEPLMRRALAIDEASLGPTITRSSLSSTPWPNYFGPSNGLGLLGGRDLAGALRKSVPSSKGSDARCTNGLYPTRIASL
jgi:hypothetical protein